MRHIPYPCFSGTAVAAVSSVVRRQQSNTGSQNFLPRHKLLDAHGMVIISQVEENSKCSVHMPNIGDPLMNFRAIRYLLRVVLIVTALMTSSSNAQTIELTSAQASVLVGAERERFLAAHNAARKEVEVGSLSWSDDLSKYALESLEQQKETLIGIAKEGWSKFEIPLPAHRADYKHGENVAAWAGTRVKTAEWGVMLWLREKSAFDKLNAESPYHVGDEKDKSEIDEKGQSRPIIIGHYTAIVWRDTQQIGAAKLEFELMDDKGKARRYVAIVCNYDPPGNRTGKKPY